MERNQEDKIKKLSNEELLETILYERFLAIEAAEEVFQRIKRKEIPDPKNYLKAILRLRSRSTPSKEKELEKLKEKAAKKLKEFLTENDLLIILDFESQNLRDEIAEGFLSEKREITNYTLNQIIRKTVKPKNKAAERLLKQYRKSEDLITILEECEGEIQMQAFNELKQRGISKEDGVDLVWTTPNPIIAEKVWEEIKFKNLSADDLLDISKYTESQKVSGEAAMKMLEKLDELSKEHLFYLLHYPKIPKKAKEEIGEKLSKFSDLTLEELMEIACSPVSIKVKMDMKKRLEEEIQKIKASGILASWEERRIKELEKEIKKLKREIKENLLIA